MPCHYLRHMPYCRHYATYATPLLITPCCQRCRFHVISCSPLMPRRDYASSSCHFHFISMRDYCHIDTDATATLPMPIAATITLRHIMPLHILPYAGDDVITLSAIYSACCITILAEGGETCHSHESADECHWLPLLTYTSYYYYHY